LSYYHSPENYAINEIELSKSKLYLYTRKL